MALFRYPQPLPSEITPRETYLRRRALMGSGIAFLAGSSAKAMPLSARKGTLPATLSDGLSPTPKDDATHYNNFYEFGMDKSDPAANSAGFRPLPWTLEIGGLVEKPLRLDLADILRSPEIEERVYRMRCVEAWSMVIPWDGIPLASLLKAAGPSAGATHVAFEGVVRPSEMPGQRAALSGLEWPYVEGLRLDEAMHPLTLLALGMYGESLPNQNGAPVRLVVPWKYGFKGIKSITRIRLVDRQPPTTWNRLASDEYGFYANVNPDVDHPRWSQATERVIGSHALFGARRQPTLMFNGYAEQVAGMYRGMDLRRNF